MNPAGILFDLDGTLLDSLGDIAAAANLVLRRRGCPEHPLRAYTGFVGSGVTELIRRALPEEARTEDVIADLEKEFRDLYGNAWNILTRPYQGIEQMLTRLCLAAVPMSVCTNKPDAFARKCVGHYFPEAGFTAVAGQQPDVPVKPAPDMALHLAKIMDLAPQDILFAGDSDVDMQTALNAGMVPVGVTWGYRSEQELKNAGAVRLISGPAELPGFFGP